MTNAQNTRRIPEVVKHLIEVGRSETFEVLANLEKRFPGLRSDRSTAGVDVSWYKIDWTSISCLLPDEDVVCLVKSMTMLEHYPGFSQGSASPIGLVFRGSPHVGRREDLINWILSRTNNPYLPYLGSVNLGAKSLDEYHELRRQEADRKLERKLERDKLVREEQAAEPERRALERKRKQAAERKRRVDVATQRLFGAIRRKDRKAISALVARGADSEARNQDGKSARMLAVEAGLAHLLESV